MTTIRATCPACGEVSLAPADIELRVDDYEPTASFYAFECPSCLGLVQKPADARVIRLLISGGVHVEAVPKPPEPRFDGPAVTHDDILDFHHLLQRDDWFDLLLETVRAS